MRNNIPSGVTRETSAMNASASLLKNWWFDIVARGAFFFTGGFLEHLAFVL